MSASGSAATYDQVPYRSLPNPHSHPASLAMVAHLLGLQAPPLPRCRVLELGSGTGPNLLPIAVDLPEADLLGIDLSARQVELCEQSVAALGLTNIQFRQLDLLNVTAELGKFDYIIAHGMYSWTPPQVRDKLLAICGENLTDHGLVFMSYNALPGWHMVQMLRDLMVYHVDGHADPAERAARAMAALNFLCDGVPKQDAYMPAAMKAFAELYRKRLSGLGAWVDSALHHDLMAPVNHPVYFRDFAQHAERHGLEYVAEAAFEVSAVATLPTAAQEFLDQNVRSRIDLEQYQDFLSMRMYRQSLLCRKGRTDALAPALGPERLLDLYISAAVRPTGSPPALKNTSVARFSGPGGASIATNHPVGKAALCVLSDIYPRAVGFRELLRLARQRLGQTPSPDQQAQDDAGTSADAQGLGQLLLESFCKRRDLVTLRAHPVQVVEHASERPVGRPLSRLQAQRGPLVTNGYATAVELEPLALAVMPLLDGTRDRKALLAIILEQLDRGQLKLNPAERPKGGGGPNQQRAALERSLELTLASLAQHALLSA